MSNRISQLPLEVAILSDTPVQMRVSQLPIEIALLDPTPIQLRVSQLAIEILIDTSIVLPTASEKTEFFIIAG